MEFVADLAEGWRDWAGDRSGDPEGVPFVMSPQLDYDVELNAFFTSAQMLSCSPNTRVGYARDLAAFLSFLSTSRGGRLWRDADEADHAAYLHWRRFDERGPRVNPATWDREVAAVVAFYRWQRHAGHTQAMPVPLGTRRGLRRGRAGHRHLERDVPLTYSHAAGRELIEWLPAAAYRQWRDVGIRGYSSAGALRDGFKGRWAARNATFCDLMVRTGLRLTEQASLSVREVPLTRNGDSYQRFWLPPTIAKGGSSRWVYVPDSVIADLASYVAIDRSDVIAAARADNRYRNLARPLMLTDASRPVVTVSGAGVTRRVKLAQLTPAERTRVLIETDQGPEPASLWLSERGTPLAVSTWKDMFAAANRRCRAAGVDLHCHAHMLRHTFAVITLEQLQRGLIAEMAALAPDQRSHYTRVFGDPLDWVRRRLGHRSVETTQIYLHALAELEMETRMALVPNDWEDTAQLHHEPSVDA